MMRPIPEYIIYLTLAIGGFFFLVTAGWQVWKNRKDAREIKAYSHSWLQYSQSGLIILPGIILVVALYYARIGLINISVLPIRSIMQITGLIIYCFSIFWLIWSIRALDKSFTHQIEIRENQEICRKGPYCWVRHPMYFCLITVPLSLFLLFPSLGICGLWIFFCFFAPLRSREEEKLFRQIMGEEYARYQQEVPMLIPGWWKIYRWFRREPPAPPVRKL